jgi:hypothetical protein
MSGSCPIPSRSRRCNCRRARPPPALRSDADEAADRSRRTAQCRPEWPGFLSVRPAWAPVRGRGSAARRLRAIARPRRGARARTRQSAGPERGQSSRRNPGIPGRRAHGDEKRQRAWYVRLRAARGWITEISKLLVIPEKAGIQRSRASAGPGLPLPRGDRSILDIARAVFAI